MASKSFIRGGWSIAYEATRPDSETAQVIQALALRQQLRNMAIGVAGSAVADDSGRLDAAITALTEWRDYLATEEEK